MGQFLPEERDIFRRIEENKKRLEQKKMGCMKDKSGYKKTKVKI